MRRPHMHDTRRGPPRNLETAVRRGASRSQAAVFFSGSAESLDGGRSAATRRPCESRACPGRRPIASAPHQRAPRDRTRRREKSEARLVSIIECSCLVIPSSEASTFRQKVPLPPHSRLLGVLFPFFLTAHPSSSGSVRPLHLALFVPDHVPGPFLIPLARSLAALVVQ